MISETAKTRIKTAAQIFAGASAVAGGYYCLDYNNYFATYDDRAPPPVFGPNTPDIRIKLTVLFSAIALFGFIMISLLAIPRNWAIEESMQNGKYPYLAA